MPCYTNKIAPNIYSFKVNNSKSTKECEICSKLSIKRPEWCQWRRSGGIFCWLWTYCTHFSSASIVDFEKVIVCWEKFFTLTYHNQREK